MLTQIKVAESGNFSTFVDRVENDDQKLKPKTLTLNLTPRAREIAENIREETGVPQTTAMERFLEWLFSQDPELRLAILNRKEEIQRELTRVAMMKMAGVNAVRAIEATADMTPEQMAQAIRTLTDRLAELCVSYQQQVERATRQRAKGK